MAVEVVPPYARSRSFPLMGLLFCACGCRLYPWGWPQATRMYISLCGCRLRPLDAEAVERRVYAEASLTPPDLAATLTPDWRPAVLAHVFFRVEVGGTVEQMAFVRRT
jgi:hypothetical protein